MTSKRMLLEMPGGPYRPMQPAIVQTALNRGGLAMPFGANTTIGNLLLAMATKRQIGSLPAPNDGGAWTTLASGQFQRTTTTDENGIAAYARLVTAAISSYSWSNTTDNLGHTGGPTDAVMYEIAGSSLAGITSLLVSDHASGTAIDLGSLGVLDATRLAFLLAGNGADGVAETVTPGVWIRDFFADRDIDSGGTNSLSAAGAFPQTWFGHTQGAGIAVEARVDLSVAQKWGGIAVLLA